MATKRKERQPDLLDSKEPVWVTAERKAIPVTKMTTEHILSCIECLNGVGDKAIPDGYLGGKVKWRKIFKAELAKRKKEKR